MKNSDEILKTKIVALQATRQDQFSFGKKVDTKNAISALKICETRKLHGQEGFYAS